MSQMSPPPGTRQVTTYADLFGYLRDFAGGLYLFLCIVGRPGLGKTEAARHALRGREIYYAKGGQLTALSFYLECHRHLNEPIVLDDVTRFLKDELGANLISALGDTTEEKLLCYATSSRRLGDVPPSFVTTSPLCILANEFPSQEYIRSRALVLWFTPTNQEIHQAVTAWFWDQEIHDWVGRNLNRLPPLEARWYVHAANDKRARRDWQRHFLRDRPEDVNESAIQSLEDDPSYPDREDKARRFGEITGADRSTYFRRLKRLRAEGRLSRPGVGPIPVRGTRPPGDSSRPAGSSQGSSSDSSVRDRFQRPIGGPAPERPMLLDDRLPHEVTQDLHEGMDDGDGEE